MRVPRLWLLATLAIAAPFVSSNAFAEADGPDFYVMTTSPDQNPYPVSFRAVFWDGMVFGPG